MSAASTGIVPLMVRLLGWTAVRVRAALPSCTCTTHWPAVGLSQMSMVAMVRLNEVFEIV